MSNLDDYVQELLQESERKIAMEIYNNILVPYFTQNASSQNAGVSECAGTYPVSGYTREDGTEVRGYMRTCGAAHAGNAQSGERRKETYKQNNEENDWHNVELDEIDRLLYKDIKEYSNMLQDGSVLEGRVEKFGDNKLSGMEALQKEAAQADRGNEQLPAKEYYKIALDLADNPDKVVSDERNHIYKAGDLPDSINQKIVFDKIAQGLKIDANNPNNIEVFKDTTVVVPRENSPVVQLIKISPITKKIIIDNYKNIVNNKKTVNTSVTFSFERSNVAMNLFGTLNKVDIKNMKQNSDGSISFIISDFYDFDYMKHRKGEGLKYSIIVEANNRAASQQEKRRLKPYVLYIPVVLKKEELKELLRVEF